MAIFRRLKDWDRVSDFNKIVKTLMDGAYVMNANDKEQYFEIKNGGVYYVIPSFGDKVASRDNRKLLEVK
ncbi:hypothetical protein [Lactococcus garvieae]